VSANRVPRAQQDLFGAGESARAKYARLIIGRPGWGALIKYELVQLLSQWVPGALGLVLRKRLYRMLLGACGRNKIRIGDNVVVDDHCLLDAKGDDNTGITIGSGVFIGRNTILSCKNGDIVLGDGANIGFNCELFSAARVEVGKDALIAAYCYLIGGDHDWRDASVPVLAQERRAAGVSLGAGAWLGAGAKVLDGVTIGEGAVIGAGAVVREAVPARAVAVGVPARVVGQREPV
jgi:acetyltransferase-like isoleucine patch superfamily enzyme